MSTETVLNLRRVPGGPAAARPTNPVRSAFLLRVSSPADKDIDRPQFFDPSCPPGFIIPHLWDHKGFYWNNSDILRTTAGIRKVS